MAQKSDYEKVVLNVQYPWNNQGGTFVFRVNEIVVKSDLKDVLTILKPLFDVCDSKLVKAVLHENGGAGITSTEPCVPMFMVQQVNEIYQLEMESELCEPTVRAHNVAATTIRSKDDHFEKYIDFFFPDGIKCSFEHFNVAAKLKARYRMLEVPSISNDTGSKLPLKQLVSFHMWKLIIIGEVKQLEKLEISSDENLTEAHNRMSRMVIGKK